ncbi:hypothetical protein [Hyalangium versicolor]|uniref:hypothetical protein n=1 Tax=Hyalangium versicolor TaxID=2861190 RepID=UPI001CCEE042|nr:hypothetical protein [Hyalangium versicolor]
MKSFGTAVVCVVTCAFFLGACGPATEGESPEGATSEVPASTKPETSDTIDPSASEIADPRVVSAQGVIGDLGSLVGSPVATYGGISTASNQWSVNCNGGSSRDIAYVWTVPATGSYSFTTSGSDFDTVLQIRNFKATSEIMGCNDDAGSGLQSRVNLSGLIRGSVLLIIIEGYAGEYGNARLNIVRN